jgi:hypothetical protein
MKEFHDNEILRLFKIIVKLYYVYVQYDSKKM